ncbi:MAG: hypothetical protein ACRDJ5_08935, partial [Actinomycetota bacterium]
LLRLLGGGYHPVSWDINGFAFDRIQVGSDGRPAFRASRRTGKLMRGPTRRFVHPNRRMPLAGTADESTVAERHDVLLIPRQRGRFEATALFRHWITREVIGRADVPIIVR